MADKPKLVRLQSPETGVVVETTEEIAERLRGFQPESKSTAKKASSSKSSKS